ncbi:hypothetical protein PSHT_15345 [Puccinia striiformis]|uniref:Uncharacterized protein n=1 Tax=Puccinia striiformis TaxID=27350 RepID=A0A2S4UFJ1_9BASI|nr:hypothetical protein PSHT_15345 [Puccinia striiformis]
MLRHTVGTSKVAPADPFNGIDYCQDELDGMTPEQRLYLDEHPQFWLVDKRKNNVINSDNKQESFEDLTGSPIADTTFPGEVLMGGTTPTGRENMQTDASSRFGRSHVPKELQVATASSGKSWCPILPRRFLPYARVNFSKSSS